MTDDPNTQLGPYLEGMLIACTDWQRMRTVSGWKFGLEELDRHAMVFTSPSGLRWRIVAQLIDQPEDQVLEVVDDRRVREFYQEACTCGHIRLLHKASERGTAWCSQCECELFNKD